MMRVAATLGFALATLTAAAAQTPPATPSAGPGVAATPGAPPGGGSSPGPVPSETPTSAATPLPIATPNYRYVYRPTPIPTPAPDPNTPQIAEIDLSDSTIFTPSDFHVRVLTSYAVTNVVAQTLGRSIPIPRAAPGLFTLDTRVPGIPFFMSYLKNQVYPVVFLAAVPDGRTASVTLPVLLR